MKVETACIDVYQGMGPECERYETCANGCYEYEYHYGTSRVHVRIRGHVFEFGWSYSDDDSLFRTEGDAVNIICKAAQRAQLEDYWNLVHGRNSGSSL
jgi:hypothetical protein